MTAAYSGGVDFAVGDGGGTEAFATLDETYSVWGLSKTNEQIEVSNFDSTAKEYILNTLADGAEITVECNHLLGNTSQEALIADVDAQTTRNIELELTDGTTTKNYAFAVVPISWTITPAIGDKNTLSFALKITGDITVT